MHNGFPTTIIGDAADVGNSSNPNTLTNITILASDISCRQCVIDNNITMEQILLPMFNATGVKSVHGTLMVVSWGLLLPLGAIIA
eukprot:7890780-Ditylum_brightwellii.AAC.1